MDQVQSLEMSEIELEGNVSVAIPGGVKLDIPNVQDVPEEKIPEANLENMEDEDLSEDLGEEVVKDSEEKKPKRGFLYDCLRLGVYGKEMDLEEVVEEDFDDETGRSLWNCCGFCLEKNATNCFGFCMERNLWNWFGLKKKSKKKKGLGVLIGVVIPVILNIFGVILFLRLPMGVGNGGILMAILIFSLGYLVTGITVSSICAISTNGTIKGGGAYYMISRVLGPELNVAGGALYVIGFVDSLSNVVGGNNDYWTKVMYCTITLVIMTIICLIGADCFGKIGCLIFLFLMVSLVAVTISFTFFEVPIFGDMYYDVVKKGYSGWRWNTFEGNLLPYSETQRSMDMVFEDIVEHCSTLKYRNISEPPIAVLSDDCNVTVPETLPSGSYYVDVETNERLNFQLLFGILFPACTGAMAGANLSGDLANPSFSIPYGTIFATAFTYFVYLFLIVMFGSTTTRFALLNNYSITTDISFFPMLVSVGIFAATLSSGLTSIIGGSRILSAISKDNIFPFLGWFSIDIGWPKKEPRYAVVVTALLTQCLIFMPSIGIIAPFVTQFFMVAYCFVNFACFALSITQAPNFRPTFKYYTWWISLGGVVMCLVFMFLLDYIIAIAVFVASAIIIGIIACYSKPKPWGDIVTAFMYYLGKKFQNRIVKKNEHIKYWRLKALALIGNPKNYFRFVRLVDDIGRPKGGLVILGTVRTGKYRENLDVYRKDKEAFLNLLNESHLKVFFEITFARRVRKGIQNLLLSAGFGGMDPDVVFIPLYDHSDVLDEIPVAGERSTSDENDGMKMHGKLLKSLTKFSPDFEKTENFVLEKSPTLGMIGENLEAGGFTLGEYMKSLVDILLIKKGLVITTGMNNLNRKNCKPSSIFDRILRRKLFTVDLWIIHSFGEKPDGINTSSKNNISTGRKKESSEENEEDEKNGEVKNEEEIVGEVEKKYKKKALTPENKKSMSLMFQLASLLLRSSIWKKFHSLRICVIVDGSSSKAELKRVKKEVSDLLKLIRIRNVKKIEIVPVDLCMVKNFLETEKDLDKAVTTFGSRRMVSEDSIPNTVDFTREDIERIVLDEEEEGEEEDEIGKGVKESEDAEEVILIEANSSQEEDDEEEDEDRNKEDEVSELEEGGEEENGGNEEFSFESPKSPLEVILDKIKDDDSIESSPIEDISTGGNFLGVEFMGGVNKSKTFSSFESLRTELLNSPKLEVEFNIKKHKSIHVDLGKRSGEINLLEDDIPEFMIGSKALSEIQQMTFLNRIIQKNSNDNSSLVFITLPHPPEKFETASSHLIYYKMLRALTDRLPPTFLVYSSVNVISTSL